MERGVIVGPAVETPALRVQWIQLAVEVLALQLQQQCADEVYVANHDDRTAFIHCRCERAATNSFVISARFPISSFVGKYTLNSCSQIPTP